MPTPLERERTIRFINRSGHWPLRTLPMKRAVANGYETGWLSAADPKTVHCEDESLLTYAAVENMVDDGWLPD